MKTWNCGFFPLKNVTLKKKHLMEEESSAFVTMIANNLGITPMNWYRSFSQHCEQNDVVKTWAYFKQSIRIRFRPKDFEFNLIQRLFKLEEKGTIHEYVSAFQT